MEVVPGKVAQIEWSDDDQGRVVELVVFDRTKISPRQADKFGKRFHSSHGACVGDWMSSERARATPEGQFIERAIDGFVSADVLLETLDQFGKIEEAGWARTMAEAIRETMRQRAAANDEEDEEIVSPVYDGTPEHRWNKEL